MLRKPFKGTVLAFGFIFSLGMVPSSVSLAKSEQINSADRFAEFYLKSLVTPYTILARIFTGIYIEDFSIDADFRTTSLKNLKLPTEYGPIYIREINQRDIVGPFQDAIKLTYELNGIRFELDEETLPLEAISIAEIAKIKSIEGDIIVSINYDVRKSDLSLSAFLRLKDGLEVDVSANLLSVQSQGDIFSSLVSGRLASGRGIKGFELSALLESITILIKDDGIREKYLSYIATTEEKSVTAVRREFPEKVHQTLSAIFPKTGNDTIDNNVLNNIREIKKLSKRGGYLIAKIKPEEPVELVELPMLIEDKDFEFLDIKITHSKNHLAKLIFDDEKFLSDKEDKDESTHTLAKRYLEGKGVPQNFEKGVKLIQGSDYSKDADLNYLMGVIFTKGIGTSKDIKKGYKHLLISSALGHREAIYTANNLEKEISFKDLKKVQGNLFKEWSERKPLKLMLSQAEAGDLEAIRGLTMHLKNGDKLPRNYFQSYIWSVVGAAMDDSISENIRESYWSAALVGKYLSISEIGKAQGRAAEIWKEDIKKAVKQNKK